jgi:hypothetical protein
LWANNALIDNGSDVVAVVNNYRNIAHNLTTPSERTRNNKNKIESSAGVVPLTGKESFTEPENPTGSIALMSSSGSLLIKDHAEESITNVQTPVDPPKFVTVSGIDVGAGVMLDMSNVRPLRVSTTFVNLRLTIVAVIVAAEMSRGKPVVAF